MGNLNSSSLPLNVSNYAPSTLINISVAPEIIDSQPGGYSRIGKREELGTITVVRFPFPSVEVRGAFKPNQIRPIVHQCKVSLCVRTYSSSKVDKGVFQDYSTSTAPLVVDLSSPELIDGSIMYAAYSDTTDSSSASEEKLERSSERKSVNWINRNMVSVFVDQLSSTLGFQSLAFTASHISPLILSQIPAVYRHTLETEPALIDSGPAAPLIEAFAFENNGNLSKTIESRATSITNYLRRFSKSPPTDGRPALPVTYVHVNWAWLTYPALLSVLASPFLIICVCFSVEKDRLVWKSSSLPLLFHGLRGWDAQELDARTLRGMEKQADSMRAHLMEDHSGTIALHRY